jgi:hypothetical protein
MTTKSRLAAAEKAAERVAAMRQARLARRPITTIEELFILLPAADDEGTSEAFFETLLDRATPEVLAVFMEAIAAERVRRGQRVEP